MDGRPHLRGTKVNGGAFYVRVQRGIMQAASWKTVRRVVAKVEHYAGELFP